MKRNNPKLQEWLFEFAFSFVIVLVFGILNTCNNTQNNDKKEERLQQNIAALVLLNPPSPELKITKISFTDASNTMVLGHENTFKIRISANYATSNVPVNIHFGHKEDFITNAGEETESSVRQFYSNTVFISSVTAGEKDYEVTLKVPAESGHTGSYIMLAHLDKDNNSEMLLSPDTEDETNNTITEATIENGEIVDAGFFANVTMVDTHLTDRDLMVESLTLSSDVMVLSADTTSDSSSVLISGTVKVKSVNLDATNVPIQFYLADASGNQIDTSVVNLRIWDKENSTYTSSYTISSLTKDQSKEYAVSLDVDPSYLTTLKTYVSTQKSLQVVAQINSGSTVAETSYSLINKNGQSNNNLYGVSITAINNSLKIVEKASSGGFTFSKGYNAGFGNEWFAAGVTFSAEASLDNDGANAYADASLPVTAIGFQFDFVKFYAWAGVAPQAVSSSGYNTYIRFIGQTLFSSSGSAGYEKTFSEEYSKSQGYTQVFWVGPVPVNVSAGAEGAMGFTLEFKIVDNFVAQTVPYLKAGAYASASVGISGFLEGGVEGTLDIIDVSLTGSASATLALYDNGLTLSGTLQEVITVVVSGPSGSIQLFAKYPYVNWCKKKAWKVYIPYPCGAGINTSYYNLASFSSYSRTYTLLSQTDSATIHF